MRRVPAAVPTDGSPTFRDAWTGNWISGAGVLCPDANLEMALLASPGVADFFVGQLDRGVDVSLVTDGSCDTEQLRRELVDVLAGHGVKTPEVRVSEVGVPERLWSGKVRQFAPHS